MPSLSRPLLMQPKKPVGATTVLRRFRRRSCRRKPCRSRQPDEVHLSRRTQLTLLTNKLTPKGQPIPSNGMINATTRRPTSVLTTLTTGTRTRRRGTTRTSNKSIMMRSMTRGRIATNLNRIIPMAERSQRELIRKSIITRTSSSHTEATMARRRIGRMTGHTGLIITTSNSNSSLRRQAITRTKSASSINSWLRRSVHTLPSGPRTQTASALHKAMSYSLKLVP